MGFSPFTRHSPFSVSVPGHTTQHFPEKATAYINPSTGVLVVQKGNEVRCWPPGWILVKPPQPSET